MILWGSPIFKCTITDYSPWHTMQFVSEPERFPSIKKRQPQENHCFQYECITIKTILRPDLTGPRVRLNLECFPYFVTVIYFKSSLYRVILFKNLNLVSTYLDRKHRTMHTLACTSYRITISIVAITWLRPPVQRKLRDCACVDVSFLILPQIM